LNAVRRPDLFGEACRSLGLPDLEPDRHSFALFDRLIFNPDDPIGYLERFSILLPLIASGKFSSMIPSLINRCGGLCPP
jgi:hypothetical protein